MPEVGAAAEHVVGRHDDLIAKFAHDVRRLLVRDRTVVVRNEHDALLARHLFRLVLPAGLSCRKGEEGEREQKR